MKDRMEEAERFKSSSGICSSPLFVLGVGWGAVKALQREGEIGQVQACGPHCFVFSM